MDGSSYYVIQVKGSLAKHWENWFEGMTVQNLGEGLTVLKGWLPDQSALFSILTRINNLNLDLISVNRSQGENHLTPE